MKTRANQKGIALLTSIFVLVTMLGLSLGLLYTAQADKREAGVNRELIKATALAEAATEIAHKKLLTSIANYQAVPTSGTATVAGHTVNYTITPVGTQRVETDAQGVQTIIQPYSIASDASSNGLTRHIEKIIDAEKTPIFQYVVFYDSDLEILPGPNMTLYGRIHTNHNLYIGSGATLTINSEFVHSVGKMYRKRKDDNTSSTGSVMIKKMGTLDLPQHGIEDPVCPCFGERLRLAVSRV